MCKRRATQSQLPHYSEILFGSVDFYTHSDRLKSYSSNSYHQSQYVHKSTNIKLKTACISILYLHLISTITLGPCAVWLEPVACPKNNSPGPCAVQLSQPVHHRLCSRIFSWTPVAGCMLP